MILKFIQEFQNKRFPYLRILSFILYTFINNEYITAVFRDVTIHEADAPCLLDHGPGVLAGLVVLRRHWDDLLLRELAGQVLKGLLLLAQFWKLIQIKITSSNFK